MAPPKVEDEVRATLQVPGAVTQPSRPSMQGSKASKASKSSFVSTAKRPVVMPGGLSITERFFFKIPPTKQQVLMCIMVRVRLPPSAPVGPHTPNRIIDLLRIAQSKHYRLSSWIDKESMSAIPFCDKAANLPTAYRFLERAGPNHWLDVYHEETNANFDTSDVTRPLWRSAVIVPKGMMPAADSALFQGQTPIFGANSEQFEYPILYDRSERNEFGLDPTPPTANSDYFEIFFTFNHCLGDGLSMFAFARTFLECTDAAHFNSLDLKLETIEVSKEPPPVIDNLFDPNIFEVFPTAAAIAMRTFGKKKKRLGHGADAPVPRPLPNSSAPLVVSPATPARGYSNARALTFNTEYMAILRKQSKREKTSIAAILVVAALAACRSVFVHSAEKEHKNVLDTDVVPKSQGWVVTNSIRHILPQSKLLQGGDRETDEGLKVFGGYAGSVSNNSLKMKDESLIWERCRIVKKGITTSFIASIRRLKVANYVYRHPKLAEMLEKKTDLSKMSQSYSVEVANLGAWEYPCAPPNAPDSDERVRLDYFGGGLNASFEGSRGLFSLGIITLGGFMTVFVSYDVKVVTVDEAEVFFTSLCKTMHNLGEAGPKATVGQVRK
ncbi:hypothetical protein HDU77_005378 [Chytriomyces hyalinus]|nr:hypothetical protein HDU77_005378 [Chytriomyces hyalinus]